MSNWLDHSSIVGKIGKYGQKISDPLAWIGGDKWTHLTSDVLPEKVNSGLSTVMKPFEKIDKTVNPVRRIKVVDRAGNIIASKPGDALAIAAGTFFGGSALLGGGAGGAGGAGAGAGEAGGLTTSSGFGGVGVDGGVAGVGEGGLGAGTAGTADVGGLAAADSAAVDAEGAVPGLTEGYGPASASPASSTSQQGSQQQQKKKRQPIPVSPINGLSAGEYQAIVDRSSGLIAQSSKSVKTRGATGEALQRGLRGEHPVDTNGVHIAAIQELNKQIEQLGAQIEAAKAKRAAKGARA